MSKFENISNTISRRDFLHTSVLGAGAFALGGFSAKSLFKRQASQPNMLIFLADDMTWHDTGCYGNRDVFTPNIDRLRTQSMKFERAFSSSPMCAPTRMSLYTGIHPVRKGAHPNHSKVYPHIKSMPHYLGRLGYEVGIIGKRHEKPWENFPFKNLGGIHHDDGKGEEMDLGKTQNFMRKNRDVPWCLVVASNQPHGPWNRGDADQYDSESLTLPSYFVDTAETRDALARYYAEISYLDNSVGEVLSYLEESGQEEETLVLFLSEQGSNFPLCKWTCYDRGVKAAMLVRWPGVAEAGSTSMSIIQYVDVLPTLIEAAGGDPEAHDFDGSSFLKTLKHPAAPHNNFAFSMQTSQGIYQGPEAYGIRSVRSQDYRLIWNLNWENEFQNLVTEKMEVYQSWKTKAEQGDAFAMQQVKLYQKRPEYELFNLTGDPFEMHNLADNGKYKSVKKELNEVLKEWMAQQGDKGVETELNALNRQG